VSHTTTSTKILQTVPFKHHFRARSLPVTMSRYTAAHNIANLRGPGDARPTALQVIEDEELLGKLSDKVFLVTGVSSGIGIDTLRAFHATGAHVYGTVRNLPKGQKVVNQILSENHREGGKIDLIEMELDNLESVRRGAQDFLQKSAGKLNVFVGNAGIEGIYLSFSLTALAFRTILLRFSVRECPNP
jgi:hypothetical protein